MGVRKNYRNLTDVERDRFVQALFHVKSTGLVDQFANMHATHFFHTIHRSSHFLPWHREFLLRFERALQAHHPDITIPYWDSTLDTNPSDPLWDNNFLGQFNSAWGLQRALGSAILPTPQQVETNQGHGTYDAFWPELETDIHNPPHRWVGGVMASTTSPGDPVFYLHHCWIDLLWARWQLAHPGTPFVSSGPGTGLNDPLMEWPDRTPVHVLDHHALGYTYDINEAIEQEGWRWCSKCQGLAFGGGAPGPCPAGGTHDHSVSGHYKLFHNAPSAPGQRNWRWCSKCQGLAFGGGAPGPCPAGGTHDHKCGRSGDYTLMHNMPSAPGQRNWRWCSKCQGLAFGRGAPGPCPAGGTHDHTVSGEYTLAHAENPRCIELRELIAEATAEILALEEDMKNATSLPERSAIAGQLRSWNAKRTSAQKEAERFGCRLN